MTISRELTEAEVEALDAGLDFAARIAGADRPLSIPQVQEMYDGFLKEAVDDSDAIVALGLSFGQCIVDSGPMAWLQVVDEFGEETSVGVLGRTVYAHPISMIQKRLNRRESVDMEQLIDGTLTQLSAQVNGDAGER